MTEINERYRRYAEQFTDKVAAVPDDAWDNQSPCPDWNTRDVVQHVVDSTCHFLTWTHRDADCPSVTDDPMAAWSAVRDAMQDCLDDPAIAKTVVERPMGSGPFEQFVDQYLILDLVVHAWDLSRAAGIDDTLAEDTVIDVRPQAEAMADTGRKMGAFGPEIDVTDATDAQTRLLALVGRSR